MKHTLINKDVLSALKEIPDESVDCIVSSPPYYGLRSYKGADTVWGGNMECEHEFTEKENVWHEGTNAGSKELTVKGAFHNNFSSVSGICPKCGVWKGQLGLEPSYQMYVEHLMLVMNELRRVLKPTGTLFWNMGDSYAGNMGSRAGWQDSKYSESREEGIDNGEAVFLKADYGKIPQKSLMMMPERFAIAMIDDRWILRNKIIWYKRNGMPSSVKDRLSNKWEYVFFFTKSEKYYFDLDSIRKPFLQPQSPYNHGKSFNFRVRDAKKGIPKEKWGNLYSASDEEIQNYDEKNYHGKIPKGEEESFGSPRARELRAFFNEKGQGGNFDYNGLDSENGNHYNPNGANPGDVIGIEKPYAIAERTKEFVEYRNLPPIEEISSFLNEYRQKMRLTIEKIEEIMQSQAPHHWFNGESYPNADDWKAIKEILNLPDMYDKTMTEIFTKPSDKQNNPNGANPGDVFNIPTMPHFFAHFAVYPESLIEPLIKAGCPKDGIVLDPFAGSGTTGVVAKRLGRSSIMIEISPEYCNIIKERMNWGTGFEIEYNFTTSVLPAEVLE